MVSSLASRACNSQKVSRVPIAPFATVGLRHQPGSETMSDIDKDENEFRSLCMAIGFIVLNWSIVEQQIDIWVNVAFIDGGGDIFRKNKDIPRSLRQKLVFLRDCFKRLPAFSTFATEGLLLVRNITDLSGERHRLVHGALARPEPENGAYHFDIVEYHLDGHSTVQFKFDPPAFSRLETALGELVTAQIAFCEKLTTAFPRWRQ
jgi:hypothetical protein